MPSLTKSKIEATRPSGDEDIRLWDDTVRGLGIRIRRRPAKTGDKPTFTRTFFVQYRSPITGKKIRHSIGQYGALTVDEARRKAKKELGKVADGGDPGRDRKLERERLTAAQTVAELCDDYMRDARAGRVTYRGRAKKASTLAIDTGRIERHIKPLLGRRLVTEIDARIVDRFAHDVRLGKTAATIRTGPRGVARVRGGEGTARRTVGLLGSMFSYAVRQGLRADNPTAGYEKGEDRTRDRALTLDEYAKLGRALRELHAEGESRAALAAIRTLALTGARKSEIFGLRRGDVDEAEQALRLAETKAGGRELRPIGRAALEALQKAPVKEGNPYLFPAGRGDGHLADVKVFHKALGRAGLVRWEAGGEAVEDGPCTLIRGAPTATLHTLRHSFATVAVDLRYSEFTIAGLLGHRMHSVTSKYAHHVDGALRAAANEVSNRIAVALDGSKVIPFSRDAAG